MHSRRMIATIRREHLPHTVYPPDTRYRTIRIRKEVSIMKKMIAMLLALVMALSLVACGEKANDGKTDNDTAKTELVLGTSADYAPFEFMYKGENGTMQYGGIDVSVGQYIADSMGK